MIDTKTEELAALYVLDLLRDDELKEFEARLETEDDLKKLVRELSTGLHAPIKEFNGPERMDLLEGIKDRIGIDPSVDVVHKDSDPAKQQVRAFPVWWIRSLAVAATLLLALNVIQFINPGQDASNLQAELVRSRASEEELLEENRTIKAFNKSWETEYMNLARRMLPFVESRGGLGQFTVIDLVDVQEKSGVTEEGDISEYFLSRSPLKLASVKMQDIPESSDSVTVGYTVWKEDENRGYLDLYNLGEAGPGRAAYLWLKGSERKQYIPVGYLPALDNGTGTFYFSVAQEKFDPVSVLITEESLDGPGRQPSPHQLMVGP